MRLTRCMEQAFDDRSVRLWRLAADALTSAEVAVISALLRAAFVPDEDAMAEVDWQPALGGRARSTSALGWRTWHGPSFVRTADGLCRTPDDDGFLHGAVRADHAAARPDGAALV